MKRLLSFCFLLLISFSLFGVTISIPYTKSSSGKLLWMRYTHIVDFTIVSGTVYFYCNGKKIVSSVFIIEED